MGGYVIARNPEGSEATPFAASSRYALDRCLNGQLQTKEMRSPRCLVTEEPVENPNEPMHRTTHKSSTRIEEYPEYKHLFPHTIHQPLHILDDSNNVTQPSLGLEILTVDSATNSGHQQIHPPRLLVTGRADRTNKSRRVMSNGSKDIPKTPGSPPRTELPKTPMSWSSEDDVLLRDLKELRKLGWKEISAYFPKRTAHACQFRWRRLVSGTLKGHRQYPPQPQPLHSQSLSLPNDQRISETNGFLQAFDNSPPPKQKRISNPFDMSPIDNDLKQLDTSSPSSPPDLFNSRCLQDRRSVSRSVSLSPLGRQQQQRGHKMDGRDMRQIGWESDGTPEVDYFKSKPISRSSEESRGLALIDPIQTCKSPTSQLVYSDSANYSAASHRHTETASWTSEEDSLLLNRRLSFDEVSILLHHRSEEAIWSRMGILRSSVPRSVRLGCTSVS